MLVLQPCCKFPETMKYKVITFGLLLSLLMLCKAQSDCIYSEELEPGKVYYAYNPNYDNFDSGKKDCKWQAYSSGPIKIDCNYEIPTENSANCIGGSLLVEFAGRKKDMYCNKGNFKDKGTNLTIEFKLPSETTGKFLCKMMTEKPDTSHSNCGSKNPKRIVGGSSTGVNEYPMMVGLYDITIGTILCGGSIISERCIISAAHCLTKIKINNLGVVVGEHDVSTGRDTNMTDVYKVNKIVPHPDYDGTSNDIAICITIKPIKFNFAVSPVCLPFEYPNYSFANSIVVLLGWGSKYFGGDRPDELRSVYVKVITNAECGKYYNVSSNELCTYTPGKDACQMDSGGPVMWEDPSTDKLVLIGIIGNGVGCADEVPARNTRVGNYLSWIWDVTANEADAASCSTK